MSFKTKLVETLETILEDAKNSSDEAYANQQALAQISKQTSETNIKELQNLIDILQMQVATLIDKVEILNENVVACTTQTEELMYTIDQFDEQADNSPQFNVNSEHKKYELN